MKATFFLPVLGQPRFAKRIEMINSLGYESTVLYFERAYHKGRLPENCKLVSLGEISHGSYFKRAIKFPIAMFKAYKHLKQADLVYSFGLDMALMARLISLGNRKVCMEVGDIRSLQMSKSLAGKLIRLIESTLLKKIDLLVVTAIDFKTEYYQSILKAKCNILVLENKLEKKIEPINRNKEIKTTEKITIGYFGLLRCAWSLKVLHYILKKYSDRYELLLAGISHNTDKELSDLLELDNVKYFGPYKSPNNLSELYGSVDIVWACYQKISCNDWNLKWARPNRFYESVMFGLPLITRSGCCDAKYIKEHDIGIIISTVEAKDVARQIMEVDLVKVKSMQQRIKAFPEEVYLYDNEINLLKQSLD